MRDFASQYFAMIKKLLSIPLGMVPKSRQMPILTGRLRGAKWIVGAGNHSCWLGIYEHKKRRLFEKVVRSGGIVYDVGAHAGYYSLLASLLVGPRGLVYAFEPVPGNLYYLREHLRRNEIKNTKICACAVWDSIGPMKFQEHQNSSMGRLDEAGSLEVKAASLDLLHATGKIRPPDVIKMDIEGAEYEALKGARNILTDYHPIIFLATHEAGIHNRCIELLETFKYKISPIGSKNILTTDEIIAV
jgi:FkbM family methyltransferase